jgi:hypothetical protein
MTEETAIEVCEGEFVQLGTIQMAGPVALVEKATAIADTLADIIKKKRLYTTISGKDFVRVEGWTTLGAMLGVLPREVETQPIENGYESTVELVRANDGAVIGRGSAICTREERNWSSRDDYAVRSMAITRATGKAYRLGFSWIMTLAGYEPTPAEEVLGEDEPKQQRQPVRKQKQTETKVAAAQRPLEAVQLHDYLHKKEARKPEEWWTETCSEKQAGLVASKFEECFAPAEDSKDRYHDSLNWLWGVESAKDLSKSQAAVTLDWLLVGGEGDEKYSLHPAASIEAAAVYHEAVLEAGQQELELPE